MIKNNVTRLLTSHNIQFVAYELPPKKVGALETASILKIPPEIVYKTIVIKHVEKRKPILAVIPATAEADLKMIASFCQVKKVTVPSQKEAEAISGLKAGGISPLALINRGFEVILDSSALEHNQIHISGGQIGLNIKLPVDDLIKLTNAKTANISKVTD